jgi:hypothetical protein
VAGRHETAGPVRGLAYEKGARLPRLPWRAPTSEECDHLLSPRKPFELAHSVSIVRLPFELSNDVRQAFWDSGQTSDTEVLKLLQTVCELNEPLHWIGAGCSPANLKTVTVEDHQRRCHVGLHVDSWDALEISALERATNRICLNIGEADRYFLYIPISLVGMTQILSTDRSFEPRSRHIEIGRLFMEKYSEVPVVRCRLAPGEAYIAPTENLIHEGSSEGQAGQDETFVIRGHIRPR